MDARLHCADVGWYKVRIFVENEVQVMQDTHPNLIQYHIWRDRKHAGNELPSLIPHTVLRSVEDLDLLLESPLNTESRG